MAWTMVMTDLLYHWAHSSRRRQIVRRGLEPGKWSRDRLWKPPYVCLAPSPQIGWMLSGGMGYEHDRVEWDLWEVWIGEQKGAEHLYYDTGRLKEVRVYERIYKRNVWWVGCRNASLSHINYNHCW